MYNKSVFSVVQVVYSGNLVIRTLEVGIGSAVAEKFAFGQIFTVQIGTCLYPWQDISPHTRIKLSPGDNLDGISEFECLVLGRLHYNGHVHTIGVDLACKIYSESLCKDQGNTSQFFVVENLLLSS